METRHRACWILVSAGFWALASCEAIGDAMRASLEPADEGRRPPVEEESRGRPVEASAPVETSTTADGATRIGLQGFESVEVGQRTPVWCWAACAEMILRYQGEATSQEEIANRVHGYGKEGEPRVAMASRYEVYRALSPDSPATPFDAIWAGVGDQVQRAADAWLEGGARSVKVEWNEEFAVQGALDQLLPATGVPIEGLLAGEPAVAGLRRTPEATDGHVYVLIGATYRAAEPSPFSELFEQLPPQWKKVAERFGSDHDVQAVELVDPLLVDDLGTPEDEMRVSLPFDEFAQRLDFVATRTDAHEALSRWSQLAVVEVE